MHAPTAQRDELNKIWAGSLLKLALGSGFQPLYEIKDYFGEVGVVRDACCSIAARASP